MAHRQLILSSVRHDMHFHQFTQRIGKRLHIHACASILSGHGRDVVKNFQPFFKLLLNHALLEELGQIGAHDRSHVVSSHLLHVMLYHDLYKLLEGRLLWIPTQLTLCL